VYAMKPDNPLYAINPTNGSPEKAEPSYVSQPSVPETPRSFPSPTSSPSSSSPSTSHRKEGASGGPGGNRPERPGLNGPKRRWPRRWWILLGIAAALLGAVGVYFAWPTPRPALRAKPSGLNCVAVGQCSEDCSRRCESGLKRFSCMVQCTERCKERGCPGGKEAYGKLTACVKRRCLLDCFGGPSEGCARCTRERCTDERQACIDQRCEPGARVGGGTAAQGTASPGS
jgi:hypothetical protein